MTLALGLGLGLTRRLRASVAAAAIIALFANGEQGLWLDPSDLTTLFQDAAGTTPVTADGQPVGLMLDKSKWGGKTLEQVLAGQPELIVNGRFDADTSWTKGTGWTITGGVAVASAVALTEFLTQPKTIISGKSYQLTYTIVSWSGGGLSATFDSTVVGTIRSAPGTYTEIIVAPISATTFGIRARFNPFTGSIDNVSLKEVPGNHATQATVAKQRAYKTDGTLSWLLDDGSDDALPVTFPNLGANCTVAYASASGVTILTGQTISGAYNLPVTGGNLYGCIIIDRALTPIKTQKLTAYLKKKAGL